MLPQRLAVQQESMCMERHPDMPFYQKRLVFSIALFVWMRRRPRSSNDRETNTRWRIHVAADTRRVDVDVRPSWTNPRSRAGLRTSSKARHTSQAPLSAVIERRFIPWASTLE